MPITPTTDTTTVTSPSVDDLYLNSFNFALSKIFSSSLMASLTTKDAILKERRDCILTENEDGCKQISPYIHSFWKDLHVKNGCVCIDDKIALPHEIKDAYVDTIHATHPGTWGMTDMDRFSKFPTAEVFDRATADNILKFLQEYVLLHGIPRTIRSYQVRCQTGQQIKTFCSQNNIQLIEAPYTITEQLA